MSIQRTILQRIPIPEFPGWESRFVLLEYPPGFAAPVHNHPVPATGYVLEGKVVSQWEGGEVERYSAGDSFIDLGVTTHILSKNETEDGPLKMLMSYVIKVEEANVNMK